MVAVVTLAKDSMLCTKVSQQSNNPNNNNNNRVIITTQQLNSPKPLALQGWKPFLQLTSLNLNHFKMVEDIGLKLLHRGPLEWHYLPIKYNEIYQAIQKLLVGGGGGHRPTHTHTHTHTHRLVI
jgi:hypothetical protein